MVDPISAAVLSNTVSKKRRSGAEPLRTLRFARPGNRSLALPHRQQYAKTKSFWSDLELETAIFGSGHLRKIHSDMNVRKFPYRNYKIFTITIEKIVIGII